MTPIMRDKTIRFRGIRLALADWISGGELTRKIGKIVELSGAVQAVRGVIADTNTRLSRMELERDALLDQGHRMQDTLIKIAAAETPGANATVRKMARLANEALGIKYQAPAPKTKEKV